MPAGDRGPESLARAGPQGAPRAHRPSRTAGGGAAEPQTRRGQRGGAGAALPGARRPGRGLHLGRFLGLFSRAVKTLAALQVRVSRRGFFPPGSVQRPPGSSWAPKCLLQGFQTTAGRPPPPGRLNRSPPGLRVASGSESVRPTSCVGLSRSVGAWPPYRDSSPVSLPLNTPPSRGWSEVGGASLLPAGRSQGSAGRGHAASPTL